MQFFVVKNLLIFMFNFNGYSPLVIPNFHQNHYYYSMDAYCLSAKLNLHKLNSFLNCIVQKQFGETLIPIGTLPVILTGTAMLNETIGSYIFFI